MPDIQPPVALPSLTDLIDNDGAGLPKPPLEQQQQQQTAEQIAATTAATEAARLAAEQLAQQQQQQTPEEIEAARVAAEAAAGTTTDDDTDLTVDQFFEQIDALRGDDLSKQIDYKGVDPMSPEGFIVRDQYIEQQAKLDLEGQIKANDPRAYAYLLHRQNGGSDEDFFQVKSFVLPELDKIKESVDLQRNVLQEALRAKGIPEKQVAVLLKAAVDAGELAADAEAAYKEIKDRDLKIADDAGKIHASRIKQQQADIASLDTVVNQLITDGKELRFQIPQADQVRFAQAFKENIHYENGQFFLIKPISKESLPKVMETELFSFLGSDLTKMIQKAALSNSATKFINKAKAGNETNRNNTQQQANTTKTLSEL